MQWYFIFNGMNMKYLLPTKSMNTQCGHTMNVCRLNNLGAFFFKKKLVLLNLTEHNGKTHAPPVPSTKALMMTPDMVVPTMKRRITYTVKLGAKATATPNTVCRAMDSSRMTRRPYLQHKDKGSDTADASHILE